MGAPAGGAATSREKTTPDARVQVYGMDPYILFLAQRRSATPYIYAYDLNADAALDGGWSNQPTWIESERIRAARDAHERDMLARLQAAPPEAFVFIDRCARSCRRGDAWEDFRHCCSESALWVAEHYHPARSFGEVHVWLRDDMPVRTRAGEPARIPPDERGQRAHDDALMTRGRGARVARGRRAMSPRVLQRQSLLAFCFD